MSYRSYSAAAALKTALFRIALPIKNTEEATKKRHVLAEARIVAHLFPMFKSL